MLSVTEDEIKKAAWYEKRIVGQIVRVEVIE